MVEIAKGKGITKLGKVEVKHRGKWQHPNDQGNSSASQGDEREREKKGKKINDRRKP